MVQILAIFPVIFVEAIRSLPQSLQRSDDVFTLNGALADSFKTLISRPFLYINIQEFRPGKYV